jgi:hypothetical protein
MHNEKLNVFLAKHFPLIKTGKKKWEWNVTKMGEKRNAYRIFAVKP